MERFDVWLALDWGEAIAWLDANCDPVPVD